MTVAPKTIIFHCGFHNTGSRVIQETLEKSRPVEGHDVYVVGHKAIHRSEFLHLLRRVRPKAPGAADTRLAGFVWAFERLVGHPAAARILLSHEDMIGNPRSGFYRHARAAAALLIGLLSASSLYFAEVITHRLARRQEGQLSERRVLHPLPGCSLRFRRAVRRRFPDRADRLYRGPSLRLDGGPAVDAADDHRQPVLLRVRGLCLSPEARRVRGPAAHGGRGRAGPGRTRHSAPGGGAGRVDQPGAWSGAAAGRVLDGPTALPPLRR